MEADFFACGETMATPDAAQQQPPDDCDDIFLLYTSPSAVDLYARADDDSPSSDESSNGGCNNDSDDALSEPEAPSPPQSPARVVVEAMEPSAVLTVRVVSEETMRALTGAAMRPLTDPPFVLPLAASQPSPVSRKRTRLQHEWDPRGDRDGGRRRLVFQSHP